MNNSICNFEGCAKKRVSKGLCSGHYTQLRAGKDLTPIGKKSALDRFWSKVDKNGANGCWVWTAATMWKGYGAFGATSKNIVRAHRFSYELHNGPIGPGMHVDHTCHNRKCVNPDHLRQVTPKQNQENRQGASVRSKSGVRSVTWDRDRGAWEVSVNHNGKTVHAGRFASIAAAEAAAIDLRNSLFTHNDSDRRTIIDGQEYAA